MQTGAAQHAGADRLDAVVRALGMGHRAGEFADIFRTMTASWGAATPAELAESDVSSDGSPVEYAVALGATDPAVQFAVEAVGPADDQRSRAALARAVMADLTDRYGVSDTRWRTVADLFLPDDPAGHAAMYGAELRRSGPVGFKVWFYPGVAGPEHAAETVEEALRRLGLEKAWASAAAHMRRDDNLDRLILFSLDLSADGAARVKLYYRHYEADGQFLSRLMAGYPGFGWSPVLDFCAVLLSGAGSLAAQPPVTCLAFTGAGGDRVQTATLYLPMWTYAADDEQVCSRVQRLLDHDPVATGQYQQVLTGVARRPLRSGRGLHNYVAWRPGSHRAAVKVYLSPELRHVNPSTRYGRSPMA
ncbi:tryptophan dimethylallyltransferase family protein [Actinoplanes missouriensis]|uniref:tryptophan dimethylallyltransferase family protein n=1 Tax=Actinoplanes missouriensis TaxID=1866 RepID=UPI0033D27C9F